MLLLPNEHRTAEEPHGSTTFLIGQGRDLSRSLTTRLRTPVLELNFVYVKTDVIDNLLTRECKIARIRIVKET